MVCSSFTSGYRAGGDSGPSASTLDFIHPPTPTQVTNQKGGRRQTETLRDKNLSGLLVYSELYPDYLSSATEEQKRASLYWTFKRPGR